MDFRSKGLTWHEIAAHSLIQRGDAAGSIGTWSLSGVDGDQKFGGNWGNVFCRVANTWKIMPGSRIFVPSISHIKLPAIARREVLGLTEEVISARHLASKS